MIRVVHFIDKKGFRKDDFWPNDERPPLELRIREYQRLGVGILLDGQCWPDPQQIKSIDHNFYHVRTERLNTQEETEEHYYYEEQ